MQQVAVSTDAASAMAPGLTEEYNVGVVPVYVNFGGQSYRHDQVPFDAFMAAQASLETAPTTSIPGPGEYLEHFKERLRDAGALVYLYPSAKLTGMGQAAELGASLEDLPVTVMEARFVLMAQGFVALAAAQVANAGGSLPEVIAAAERARKRVGVSFVLDEVDLMVKGGRLPGVQAQMRGKFMINSFADGGPTIRGTFDRHADAIEEMLALLERDTAGGRKIHLAVHHAGRPDDGRAFLERAAARIGAEQTYLCPDSILIRVYQGKAVAVAYYIEE
jgi:DegV family protein with EDD domain